jgi:hypothetical protein
MKPLHDLLASAGGDGSPRATIAVPPRFGKTSAIIRGLAAAIRRRDGRGKMQIVYATYTTAFKSELSRELGQYQRQDLPPRFWCDQVTVAELVYVRFGDPMAGMTPDVLVVDSPFKTTTQALDEAAICEAIAWIDNAIARMRPDGSVVVVDTRVAVNDLIGRLRDTTAWSQVDIHAADLNGESVWPERWPTSALQSLRESVGEDRWRTMFMCQPTRLAAEVEA